MNTQPKALRLADALEDTDGAQDHDQAAAELRRLHRVELAYNEWITKTEWVQETAQPKELGKHRADILTKRIEVLHEVNQMLVEALEITVPYLPAMTATLSEVEDALAKAKEQA